MTTEAAEMLVCKVQDLNMGGEFAMDADGLRTAFIKRQLERLLNHRRSSWSVRAAHELRRYIGWFAESIPASEKEAIAAQLSKLEQEVSKRD